jgi:hypothetical protein
MAEGVETSVHPRLPHDLRHTWASWHVQRGTPLQVRKELGGWETLEIVQRHAHLSADHPAQRAQSHLPVAEVIELPQGAASASPGKTADRSRLTVISLYWGKTGK